MPRFFPRLLQILSTTLLALSLGTMAVPRLASGLYQAGLDPLLSSLTRKDAPVSLQQLSVAEHSYAQSLVWQQDANSLALLAQFRLLVAAHNDDPVERRLLVSSARDQILLSLERGPMQPYAWYSLALIEHGALRHGPLFQTALQASMALGSVDPNLILARARLALETWTDLDEETHRLARDQIIAVAQKQPLTLAAIAQGPALHALVLELLADQPDLIMKIWPPPS